MGERTPSECPHHSKTSAWGMTSVGKFSVFGKNTKGAWEGKADCVGQVERREMGMEGGKPEAGP